MVEPFRQLRFLRQRQYGPIYCITSKVYFNVVLETNVYMQLSVCNLSEVSVCLSVVVLVVE